MKQIKFSHRYPKLHCQRFAELIAVKPIQITKETNARLLLYDTQYEDADGNIGFYPLRPGSYLRLIFDGDAGIPFTTIRKAYPPSKVEYYSKSVGDMFEIVITDGGEE